MAAAAMVKDVFIVTVARSYPDDGKSLLSRLAAEKLSRSEQGSRGYYR